MQDVYLRKAHENLRSAENAFNDGAYNACANRAYYAAYQAAIAVLLAKGFTPKTDHQIVQAMFSSELVNKRKVFASHLKGYLPILQRRRNTADYEPVEITKKDAAAQVKQAREFVTIVTSEIHQ
jgi:uncharacterized protein (UPF0332 family)